jgi:hypothetical protein
LLFCANSQEGRTWIVTDGQRKNAQARRLDGRIWERLDKKAWTLPGSVASWPIGLREAVPYPAIALVEGGPDLLAALHLAWCAGREDRIAPVAILGASLVIPAPVLPLFAGKHVRLFAHLDKSGLKAERCWFQQLKNAGALVDRYNFGGFVTVDGKAVTDLNDFVSVSVDQWEEDRQAIEEAFLL